MDENNQVKIEPQIEKEIAPQSEDLSASSVEVENIVLPTTDEEQEKIEKEIYGEKKHKKIKKLREKGKLYGIDVPYLKHPLTKTKPSVIFIVLSSIFSLLTVALTVGIIYCLFGLGWYKGIVNIFSVGLGFSSHQSWDLLGIVQIFQFFGTIFMLAIGVLFIVLIVGVEALFITLTIKFIKNINLSIEERAYSESIKKTIIGLIAVIIIPIATVAIMHYQSKSTTTNWGALYALCAIIAVVCGVVLTLIIVERVKAKKQLATITPEQVEAFKKHTDALERVKKYKKRKAKRVLGKKF